MKRSLIFLTVIFSAFAGAIIGIVFMMDFLELDGAAYNSIEEHQQSKLVNIPRVDSVAQKFTGVNFKEAASRVIPAVVHIRTVYGAGEFSINPLEYRFNPSARSSGSGVIISDDGYIVTNNHVIEDANRIEVVMNNNQRFFAKLIGRDQSTDLALLKIKSTNLPFLPYGDSDLVAPADWVLAVGNPFNLNSTITAGIVSAKARNIGVLGDRNNLDVESFIQTDAAINPGNSGGALVNLNGELIGINSAIATLTGTYSGYSFAIPVNLVKKVMDDLLEFGKVQRGILGVRIADVSAELAEDQDLTVLQGVFIIQVNRGSAAEDSGLETGDVIVAINDYPVSNVSELQEHVARHRPGAKVKVSVHRDNREQQISCTLKDIEGSQEMKRRPVEYKMEGATMEDISYQELAKFNIEGGVYMRKVEPGKWRKAGVKTDFIITHIDKVEVENVEDLNRMMEHKNGGILIEGFFKTSLDKEAFGLIW